MGDIFDSSPIVFLRDQIKQRLKQQPDSRWADVKQWLYDTGDVAPNCILQHGARIFYEISPEGSHAAANSAASPPPSSPEDAVSQRSRLAVAGRASSSEAQDDADAGPVMVDQDAIYDIGAAISNRGKGWSERRPMSANLCKGSVNFINRDTIKARGMDRCIDTRSNTAVLNWRAGNEYLHIFGDKRFRRTTCVVVSSEQIGGVDVALTEDRSHWEASLTPVRDSSSDEDLPNSMVLPDPEQQRWKTRARLIEYLTDEIHPPTRHVADEEDNRRVSRPTKRLRR